MNVIEANGSEYDLLTAPTPHRCRLDTFKILYIYQIDMATSRLLHNHPSGDPTPSKADIEMTREIQKAAAPLGVTVHDHLVIGAAGHASFKGLGLL